jgi:hypothetical protein
MPGQGLLPINLGAMALSDKIAYYDVEGVTNDVDNAPASDRRSAKRCHDSAQPRTDDLRQDCGRSFQSDAAPRARVRNADHGAVRRCQVDHAADGCGAQNGGTDTETVDKGTDVDGPALVWAAVRRWMEQVDPSYMT